MKEKLMRFLSVKLLIGVTAGAVVLGAAVAVVPGLTALSPWKQVRKSMEKTADAVKEQPSVAAINDVLDKGSIELGMNTADLTFGLLKLDLSAKLYTAIKEKSLALYAGAMMNGNPMLDAAVRADEEKIIVSSDVLLDEVYGIRGEAVPDMQNELNAFAKEVKKELGKHFVDNVATDKTVDTVTFGAEEVSVERITFRADAETIAELSYQTAVYLKASDTFAQLIGSYAAYTDYGEEAVQEVYASLDELIGKKEEIEQQLGDAGVVVSFLITEEDYLAGVECTASRAGERMEYSVSAGPAPDCINEIRILTAVNGDEYRIHYVTEENSETAFRSSLAFTVNGTEAVKLLAERNPENGTYEVNAYKNGEEDSCFRVAGTVLPEEESTVIAVEELSLDSVSYELGISIMIKKEDEIPQAPECTEILPPDPESVNRIIEDLTEELNGLIGMFF